MELFGREFSLEQAIWLAEVYATPDEDLVHRATLEIIAALRESQCREKAAVKDLTKLARKPITPCHSCSKSCVAPASLAKEYEIKWCKDWEWRGPQETGEGENDNG